MTHTSDTHTFSRAKPTVARTGLGRFAQEIGLLAGFLLLFFWLVALASYSLQDSAWSTSGQGVLVLNRGGRLGAWLADGSYFLLGSSVWWCLTVGTHAWLTGVAQWLRGHALLQERADTPLPGQGLTARLAASPCGYWLGLLLLLGASTSLEWSRFYRYEVNLPGHGGGVLGYLLGSLATRWLGFAGTGLVAIALGLVGVALAFRFSWVRVAERVGALIYIELESRREQREVAQDVAMGQRAARERGAGLFGERPEEGRSANRRPAMIEPVMTESPPTKQAVKVPPQPVHKVTPSASLPLVSLLDDALPHQESVAPETLEMTSRLIEKKLKDFGVDVRVVLAQPGPVVTRYEIEPATGVKGAQIVGLAKDLARSLSLVSIRVVETIPDKNYMALELPNAKRQTIKLSEILGARVYREADSLLTMGLGKDIVGNPVVVDLAKMPHVLVAGTTGSGKSVGINAMILSLLYKAQAHEVRLLMIDPKMLEMSVYEGIPHLLAPVVTDMRQAAQGLSWCVAEMERRYKLLSKMGVRHLAGYNAKIDEAASREAFIDNPFSLTPESPEPLERLPHIVVVIDELADLMMVVGKRVEELIARLAQKARAAGIHLILATQRPSVDVITGLIKANIPTRISFKVSSKIDSRTILDQMGAEALLGLGDMLYMAGSGTPTRIHGAFVSDEEVHRVVSYLKSQGEPNYIEGVLEGGTDETESDMAGNGKDPMFDQAVAVVLESRKATIAQVQRSLKMGYNRAARLFEEMENAGVVSAMSNKGQREILVPEREK